MDRSDINMELDLSRIIQDVLRAAAVGDFGKIETLADELKAWSRAAKKEPVDRGAGTFTQGPT